MDDSGIAASKHEVLVVGANPAWQKSVVCDRWEPGEVVRVRLTSTAPAGKGFNTALAIRSWGVSVELVSGVGPDAADWEAACRAQGIGLDVFRLAGPIRTATTIRDLSRDGVTEMVEEGFGVEEGAEEDLVRAVERKGAAARAVVVAGTFPPGMSPRQLFESLSGATVPVVVDSVPGVRVLRDLDRVPGVLFAKLNEAEWKGVFGESDLGSALRAARRRWPGACLLATRGREGALVWGPGGDVHSLTGDPLPADREIHPIGAGDAFTAGMVVELLSGSAPLPACRRGMAVARASCFHPLPARFSREDVDRQLPRVRLEPVRV